MNLLYDIMFHGTIIVINVWVYLPFVDSISELWMLISHNNISVWNGLPGIFPWSKRAMWQAFDYPKNIMFSENVLIHT